MTRLKTLTFFIYFICCVNIIWSQSNINISHYTKDYGKHYRWVYDIAQDQNGLIWFANHTGLRKYDGIEFSTYQHKKEDSTTISVNTLNRIAKDNEGNIWAFGEDLVFNKFNIETEQVIRVKEFYKDHILQENFNFQLKDFKSLANGFYVLLYETESNNNSFWKYDVALKAFQHVIDVQNDDTTHFEYFSEQDETHLWFWNWEEGYTSLDLNKLTTQAFKTEGMETPIDGNRKFWYPSSSETKLESFELPEEIEVDKIDRLHLDNLGDIWFYHNDSELYRFQLKTKKLTRFTDPMFDKASGKQLMYNMFVDRDGGIWNGHFFGAIRFSKKSNLFNTYLSISESQSAINTNFFNARDIVELSPTQFLIKENNNDIVQLNALTNEAKKLTKSARINVDKTIYSLVLDTEGFLWYNTNDAIIRRNLTTNEEKIYNVSSDVVLSQLTEDAFKKHWPRLFIDASNQVWWCDLSGAYLLDKSKKELNKITLQRTNSNEYIDFKYASYDFENDKIYATWSGGVYSLDCKKRDASLINIFKPNEGYDTLTTCVFFWNNEYWLSTNKGLIRFNPKTNERKTYNIKEGLSSNIVLSAIHSDKHVWMATLLGLSRLDIETNAITTYTTEQGLPANEFNIWSYLKTTTNKLMFGTRNGIVAVNPSEFNTKKGNSGQLNLIGMATYNQSKDKINFHPNHLNKANTSIQIKPNERTLAIRYALTNYENTGKNKYFRLMEGLDNNWVSDDANTEAMYLEMPPGNYTFRVRANGPDMRPAENEINIAVEVLQIWYLRWWAIASYVMAFTMAIGMFYQRRTNRKIAIQEAKSIQELDIAKTRMYTNITHEFRTPLTVMLGMNDAIKDYSNEGKTQKILEANSMIDRNAKNLLSLINQMLELAKLESGKLRINNLQGNIVDYLKYRLESFQSYAIEKNISIEFETYYDEVIMDFDVDKISHILGNLISNAIKFTSKGGAIKVFLNQISKNDNNYIELKIKDNGIGIEADKLTHIFDRFYQVDDSNTRKAHGSGIGLSLVKELIKLMDGDVAVESEVNNGSVFTVILPITNDAEIAKTFEGQTSNQWSERTFNTSFQDSAIESYNEDASLILVVEDNPDVLHYISVSLQNDYRIINAKNGEDGISKAIEHIPDIIISDVMMPLKDGFELCETIKADERTSHIPIVLLTGKADVDSKIEGLEHGADVYLEKPFNKRELLVRLKNLMVLRSEIQKRFTEKELSKTIEELPKLENEFLIKLRTIILENLEDEDFNAHKLSELAFISRTQIHRKLSALTGESTTYLIRKVKLEKAKELLSSGNYNVSEVAYMVGFKTQAHFSRVFSETFSIPPSKYKHS
jgi:signal transduction histidine kinase/DNA-binding response OmpR family regulator/ligand-binding sensor domain-containing protein